eukprot:4372798-Karenia_brevis.AAC.1
MTARLFKKLDRDGDGFLDIAELKRFAVLTGFEGDPFVWAEEYKQMCTEFKCQLTSGLNSDAFIALVDDNSGMGCYCKDCQLHQLCEEVSHLPMCEEIQSTYWPSKVAELRLENALLLERSQVIVKDLERIQLELCAEKGSRHELLGGMQRQLEVAEGAIEAWRVPCAYLEQQNWQIQTV